MHCPKCERYTTEVTCYPCKKKEEKAAQKAANASVS